MLVVQRFNCVNHIYVSTHVDESVSHVMYQEYHKTLCGKNISGRVVENSDSVVSTCKRCLYRLEKQRKRG